MKERMETWNEGLEVTLPWTGEPWRARESIKTESSREFLTLFVSSFSIAIGDSCCYKSTDFWLQLKGSFLCTAVYLFYCLFKESASLLVYLTKSVLCPTPLTLNCLLLLAINSPLFSIKVTGAHLFFNCLPCTLPTMPSNLHPEVKCQPFLSLGDCHHASGGQRGTTMVINMEF